MRERANQSDRTARKELGAYGARGTEGWTRVNEKWNGDYR